MHTSWILNSEPFKCASMILFQRIHWVRKINSAAQNYQKTDSLSEAPLAIVKKVIKDLN